MQEISPANLDPSQEDWDHRAVEVVAAPERMSARLPLGWLTFLAVVLLVGGMWWHPEMVRFMSGHDLAAPPDPMADWQMLATLFATIGGIILLGYILVGHNRDRQRTQQWEAQCEDLVQRMRDMQARLVQKQSTESSLRLQLHELRTNYDRLTQAHGALEATLGRVRRDEEAFTYQRRELVRSKDVLELHVQARTEQLQKLQRAYESILNSAGEGICGLDAAGRITFANPAAARMMGVTILEMTGQPAREVFPDFLKDNAIPPGEAAGENPVEVVARRRDGSSYGAEFVRTPIREHGRVVGEVLLFKDITERKSAAENLARKAAELARSNAELEQFAFVASHDLQEPLRKIQAFGDRLKAKCATVNLEEGRDYLDRMQNAAARMQTLIYDLLMFSRVISRTEPFVRVDLKTVAREVIGDLEVRIEKTGGCVDVGDLPSIEADAPQMRQLFQNLIGNALKFHAPGIAPVVRVEGRLLPAQAGDTAASSEAGDEPALCELTVADNGIGFDEKYLDRIFAVFQRLHGREAYEGTGIGLAVCRRIAERHGGKITARSTPGQGATFIVTLPVRQEGKRKGPACVI
jgi:PAS domain S-box-containing protein